MEKPIKREKTKPLTPGLFRKRAVRSVKKKNNNNTKITKKLIEKLEMI